jgi:hypothetical protein
MLRRTRTRHVCRIVLGVAVVLAGPWPGRASAHTFVDSTNPKAGSTEREAPNIYSASEAVSSASPDALSYWSHSEGHFVWSVVFLDVITVCLLRRDSHTPDKEIWGNLARTRYPQIAKVVVGYPVEIWC